MVKAMRMKALPARRIDVIGRDQQAGGDGDTGGAEAESHRVNMRDIDAASSAPSFSLATARIALPVSVKRMSSHSASATTKTATKPIDARHARGR